MKHPLLRSATSLLLASSLTIGLVVPAIAATPAASQAAEQKVISNSSLGTVKVNQLSSFELQDVNILPSSNGSTVSFKVVVHNNSNADLNLVDYWVKLKTKAGSKFSVTLLPEDKTKERVSAKTSQVLTYYSTVSSNISVSDLQFEFIKWDFNYSNFEQSLGTISVPNNYSGITPTNQIRSLKLSGTTILSSVDRVLMNKTEKYHKPSITLKLENSGTQSFKLPAYEYKLITANGLIYPLTANGPENMLLTPKQTGDVKLSGSIPIEVDTKGWKLLITQPIEGTQISIPISSYELPAASSQDGGSIGTEYSFSNASGDYYVVINSIHRLPLEDNDLLTTDLTISNKGSETLTIPNFTGMFVLDQNVEVAGSIVRFDKVIGIQPGSSISLQLYANIPYTYEFSELKVVLQEKEEDNTVVDLVEVYNNSELSSIKTIDVNNSYNLDVIGQRSSISVRDVLTYEGRSANIFSVQVVAENLEKRFSNITSLNAYFETDNGLLYPANVDLSENKVAPGGITLVNFWKQLPKSIDTKKLKLVVGEAVLGEDGKATSMYVNPVALALPEENYNISTDLRELDLYPYTFSVNKIRTQINYDNWQVLVTFNYNLEKDLLVESNDEQHKIVLEVSDLDDKLKFSEVFSLSGDKALEIGSHKGEFSMSDTDLISQIQTLKDYNLNVYHQYTNGQKKLIGSKKIRWFTTTE